MLAHLPFASLRSSKCSCFAVRVARFVRSSKCDSLPVLYFGSRQQVQSAVQDEHPQGTLAGHGWGGAGELVFCARSRLSATFGRRAKQVGIESPQNCVFEERAQRLTRNCSGNASVESSLANTFGRSFGGGVNGFPTRRVCFAAGAACCECTAQVEIRGVQLNNLHVLFKFSGDLVLLAYSTQQKKFDTSLQLYFFRDNALHRLASLLP